jgi:hypothetical protein
MVIHLLFLSIKKMNKRKLMKEALWPQLALLFPDDETRSS